MDSYRQRTDRYIELMKRQEKVIFWLCCRYARFRRDRSLDLMQDVRERIWRTLDHLAVDASPDQERAWVRWQTRSVLDRHRRHAALPTAPLDQADDVADAELDRETERQELLDELMAFLPPDDRRLLQRQLQGYSAQEIAAELHLSAHTVQNRLSLARQRLSQIYTQINNKP